MIVRIFEDGQYRLDDTLHAALNDLDDAVVSYVENGDRESFPAAYAELLAYVHEHGERLDGDELTASDVMLPPAGLTFEEAGTEFTGEGLVPDPPEAG